MVKHILVIDDMEDWRTTLSGLLTDEGYKVTAVGDRESAIKAVSASTFDLAVIDVRLDESDEDNTAGLNLAKELKDVQRNLPVIIITGYDVLVTVDRAMRPDEKGEKLAIDFVRKTETSELINIIKRNLGSPESQSS